MAHRHELSAAEWARISPLLPARYTKGTYYADHRPGRKPVFDRAAYRRRPAIECTVGALKEARSVATRYEKFALQYLALVKLSMIRLLVRQLERARARRE